MPTSLISKMLRLHLAARSEINFLVRVPTRCSFFITEGYKRSRPSCPNKCFNKLVLVMSGKNGKLSCIQNKTWKCFGHIKASCEAPWCLWDLWDLWCRWGLWCVSVVKTRHDEEENVKRLGKKTRGNLIVVIASMLHCATWS